MTREEAKEILISTLRDINSNDNSFEYTTEQFTEAMLIAIESLSNPSLPSNLDEAAQKVEDYYDVGEEYGYLYCHRGDIKDAFKAGAEWLAGQGVTMEAVIGMATKEISINVSQQTLDELNLCPGDKVVVQIRKK